MTILNHPDTSVIQGHNELAILDEIIRGVSRKAKLDQAPNLVTISLEGPVLDYKICTR